MGDEWEMPGADVILKKAFASCEEPMIPPVEAAAALDGWLPHSASRSNEILEAICRRLGGSAASARRDSDLRYEVQRALRNGGLIAVRRQRVLDYSSIPWTPALPVGQPRSEAAREKPGLRFRFVHHETFEPVVGLRVVVQSDDGRTETRQTDSSGEVYFTTEAQRRFRIVDVLDPFRIATIRGANG